jgi:hypothetical protein
MLAMLDGGAERAVPGFKTENLLRAPSSIKLLNFINFESFPSRQEALNQEERKSSRFKQRNPLRS